MGARDDYDSRMIDAATRVSSSATVVLGIASALQQHAEYAVGASDLGTAPPDQDGMVQLWNTLVTLRIATGLAQDAWRELNNAGASWCAVWNEVTHSYVDESQLTYEGDRT